MGEDLEIRRLKSQIKKDIKMFIDKKLNSTFGVNSHLLLRDLAKISKDKKNYIDNLKDGKVFNFEYDILTGDKLIISKQWETIKNIKEYQDINSEFNDILKIDYTQDKNYDSSGIYNSISLTKNGNSEGNGLDSYSKIKKQNISLDSGIYYKLNNILDIENNQNIEYSIKSDPVFKYSINSSKITDFKPTYNYQLDFLEGSYVTEENVLTPIKNYNNGIEFYADDIYKNYDDVSLKITKNYDLNNSSFTNLGFSYNNIKILDLSSTQVKFYKDDTELLHENGFVKLSQDGLLKTKKDALLKSITSEITSLNNGTLTNLSTTSSNLGTGCILSIVSDGTNITEITVTSQGSGYVKNDTITVAQADIGSNTDLIITLNGSEFETFTSFDLISTTDLSNSDIYTIEQKVEIKTQRLDGTQNYISFTKNLELSNLFNISQMYLRTGSSNNEFYKVDIDSSSNYVISSEKLDINIPYYAYVYYNVSNIESLKSDQQVYHIKLNEAIEDIHYDASNSFKIDSTNIESFKILDSSQIKLYSNNTFLNPEKLNHLFRIDQNEPIFVDTVNLDDSKFLIEIENNIKLMDNSSITFKRIGYPDIEGSFYKYSTGNNILFSTGDKYSKLDIIPYGYEVEIINILPINSYQFYENNSIVSFTVTEGFYFSTENSDSYFIDLSGSYGLINNSNIKISKNDVLITLPDWESYTAQSSFNLKHVSLKNRKLNYVMDDQVVSIKLSKNRSEVENFKIRLNYFDNTTFNDIGNFIYYFSKGDTTFYYNDKYELNIDGEDMNIYMIGEQNNNIYFSTIERLILSAESNYQFHSKDYKINKTLNYNEILFQSNTYFEGTVTEAIDLSNLKLSLKTNDISNNFMQFEDSSNINANLYFSNIKKDKNEFTINKNSKLDFSFPEELLYKNFVKTVDTTEEIIEEVKWDEYTAYKIFEYIDFYINDQKIDKLDEDIYKLSQLYDNDSFDLIPKKMDDKFTLYLPTFFWFNSNSSNYLPLISLRNSNITIKTKINKLQNLVRNDVSNINYEQFNKELKISLFTDTILLDNFERERFAIYNHEYLIQRNISLPKFDIRSEKISLPISIKGLVKDIFWVFESKKTGYNYYQEITYEEDVYEKNYLEAKNKYELFILNNRQYSIEISTDFKDKFIVLDKINLLIENDSDISIVKTIKSNFYLKKFDINFVLYLLFYELKFTEDLLTNGEYLIIRKKIILLILYFKNTYQRKNINKINPVKSLEFKVNGRALLSNTNPNYYNSVVPFEKFSKTPEIGIHCYSFSLYPVLTQPSGHLNFNLLSEPTLILNMNERINDEVVSVKTIFKEYQILRIIGGQASLSWI